MQLINTVVQGDCHELLRQLEPHSIDAVISDFPYNTTANAYDKEPINLPVLWELLARVLKPKGAVVTTSAQPFTSKLVMSNLKWFKHETIWHKSHATGHLSANVKPMAEHENIIVFSSGKVTYNPQLQTKPKEDIRPVGNRTATGNYGQYNEVAVRTIAADKSYPRSVIKVNHNRCSQGSHPNQKPLALFEYLIRTYTNEGDTILDPFAGSGTTGIAAINTGRNYILLEKDEGYYQTAKQRIEEATRQLRMAV